MAGFTAGLALAQEGDPLKSPACGAALEAPTSARAARARDPAHAAQAEQARKRAAQACLGTNEKTPPPARTVQPPQAVAPTGLVPPRPSVAVPAPAPLPVPPAIPRPSVVTNCDPGGCWDSSGNRLNRAGPTLIGPAGVCTLQGNLLHCP